MYFAYYSILFMGGRFSDTDTMYSAMHSVLQKSNPLKLFALLSATELDSKPNNSTCHSHLLVTIRTAPSTWILSIHVG